LAHEYQEGADARQEETSSLQNPMALAWSPALKLYSRSPVVPVLQKASQ
jgi:hypothetical protein